MNILLMPNSFPPTLGGLELAVSRLAVELAGQGHRVTVITNGARWRPRVERWAPGVTLCRLPVAFPRVVGAAGARALAASAGRSLASPVLGMVALSQLRHLLRELQPDVVNLHYVGENAALYYLARRSEGGSRPASVVSVHGNDLERYGRRGRLSRHVTRATLRAADRVLANSRALLGRAIEIEPSAAGKSAVMPNGVDCAEFEGVSPFNYPRRYILCIGSFVPKKGQDVLIRAFEIVQRRHPDVDLLLAGDGRERARCERLTADLAIDKAVLFLGAVGRDRIPGLLVGCEMLVLPSRSEAFGMVLLEAMASGKPVVATRVDGIPELVNDGENGMLVNPDDPRELSEAICALLQDTHLAKRLGAKGSELAKDYSWDAIAQRYIAVYEEAIA